MHADRQVDQRAGQRRLADVDAVEGDGGAGHVAQDGDVADEPLGRDQAEGGDADLVDQLRGRARQRRGHTAQLAAGVVDELQVDDVAVGKAADVARDDARDLERLGQRRQAGRIGGAVGQLGVGGHRVGDRALRRQLAPDDALQLDAQDALQLIDDLRLDAERIEPEQRVRLGGPRSRCEQEQQSHHERTHSVGFRPHHTALTQRRQLRLQTLGQLLDGLGPELGAKQVGQVDLRHRQLAAQPLEIACR